MPTGDDPSVRSIYLVWKRLSEHPHGSGNTSQVILSNFPAMTCMVGFFPQGFFIEGFPRHTSRMGKSISLGVRIFTLCAIEVLIVSLCKWYNPEDIISSFFYFAGFKVLYWVWCLLVGGPALPSDSSPSVVLWVCMCGYCGALVWFILCVSLLLIYLSGDDFGLKFCLWDHYQCL